MTYFNILMKEINKLRKFEAFFVELLWWSVAWAGAHCPGVCRVEFSNWLVSLCIRTLFHGEPMTLEAISPQY